MRENSPQMPTLKKKYNSNEIVVNNKSSYKCHLHKCQQILDNIHYDKVVLRAMGRATSRACRLALQLNNDNFNTFDLKARTYSVELNENKHIKPLKGADKDGFDPDAIDITMINPSYVPAIEIKVCKSTIEIEKIRQAKNKDFMRSNRLANNQQVTARDCRTQHATILTTNLNRVDMQSEQQKKEIETLEAALTSETEKLVALKHLIDRDKQMRPSLKKHTFNNERDAKFYQDALEQMDADKTEAELANLKVEMISSKYERIEQLKRALAEFEGLEPTNESLQVRIEELKKSRLSLDMSFDDIL